MNPNAISQAAQDAANRQAEDAFSPEKLTDMSPDEAGIISKYITALERKQADLQRQLADARKDSERLDWLEQKGKAHWWAPRRHVDGYEILTRAAIDAAMAAQQPK